MFTLLAAALAAVAVVALASGGEDRSPAPPATGEPQESQSACDSTLAPGGDLEAFVATLEPGQTGCLSEGEHAPPDGTLKVETPEITLRAVPGESATIAGRLWIAPGADGVTIEGLRLDGRNDGDGPSPTISANDVVLRGNDITNGQSAICVSVGDGPGRPSGTIIEGNLIHDCGELPRTNHHHGIYVVDATGTVIRDNWIYDNADRGIQLYPNADRSLITGNVIDDNGQGVIISGSDEELSEDNLIEGNLITNSEARHNVESNWQGDAVGSGNVVRRNCLFGGARDDGDGGLETPAEGFTAAENLVADPGYADRENADYSLAADSPCGPLLG